MNVLSVINFRLRTLLIVTLVSFLAAGCPFTLPRSVEHLEILKQGVDVWNQWREDNPEVSPVLIYFRTELVGMDLAGVNFSGMELESDLSSANLESASFTGASMGRTVFFGANLSGSDLSGAHAISTVFTSADLTGADLSGLELLFADFKDADLSRSNISGIFGWEEIVNIIFGVQNAPDGFREWALANGAVEVE